MAKNKFVDYEKTNGDDHIDYMLSKDHSKPANSITTEQLKPTRVPEKNSSIEKLLEKNRTGSVETLTEKQLDGKGKFGSKFRDPSTYEGNINKLEEKRIKDGVEKEKYELASSTPKEKRWWETKDAKNLVIAKHNYKFAEVSRIEKDAFPIESLEGGENFPIESLKGGENFGMDNPGDEDFGIDNQDNGFEQLSHAINDFGGSKIAEGSILLPDGYDEANIESGLRDFMEENHPELPFSIDSFDIEGGIASYKIGVDDFDIEDIGGDAPLAEFDGSDEIMEGSPDFALNGFGRKSHSDFPIVTSKKK